jgi:ATP-dependent helicase YprA (DUF1998 family)
LTGFIDPLEATQVVGDAYRRYLSTFFQPADKELAAQLASQLEHSYKLTRGPILQARSPYMQGASLRGLVESGLLHPRLVEVDAEALPPDRPLYLHQERAIRKLVAGRNVAIATGTGSGKTEAFTVPIVNSLLLEADRGTLGEPGVRALLLYPMNALANDQMKRLQSFLSAFPDITFGRYVGDTQDNRQAALEVYRRRFRRDPSPNELIDRHSMQEAPPHILLTNYAMLEYLLLRPEDSGFFDGESGRHWRYVVLDEVHVYDGAKGSELAMLLRRVRDRVNGSERGKLTCIATSATLGTTGPGRRRVMAFLPALFDEDFEWSAEDAGRQDLVEPERHPLATSFATWTARADLFRTLAELVRAGAEPPQLVGHLPEPHRGEATASVEVLLFHALAQEAHVARLQRELEGHCRGVEDLAERVFPEISDEGDRLRSLVCLVDICSRARPATGGSSLLPARYHFWLRSLEGAFVCHHPDHPASEPRLLLSRHERCPACVAQGINAQMFEFAACRRCGAGYAVGRLEQGVAGLFRLVQPGLGDEGLVCFALTPPRILVDDEDEMASGDEGEVLGSAGQEFLCAGCGALGEISSLACGCQPGLAMVVTRAQPSKLDRVVRRCALCRGKSSLPIIARFQTGTDAPVSVVATSLYQQIPPSADEVQAGKPGEGRKLLIFSDSRQDAAFFASYLERTYRQLVARRLLWRHIARCGEEGARFSDCVEPVARFAEDRLLLDPDQRSRNRTTVRSWLLREALAVDPRQSLEGVGLVEVTVDLPRSVRPSPALLALGFTEPETFDLARVLIGTLRASAAVDLPPDVDISDPMFSPRNVVTTVRQYDSIRGVLAWMPGGSATNRRLSYLQRLLERRGIRTDPKELLATLWEDWLAERGSGWEKVLPERNVARQGVVRAIDFEWLVFLPAGPSHFPWRCDTCRQVAWRHVSQVCPALGCPGTLHAFAGDDDNHYRRLYSDLKPLWLAVEEHTAQLETDTAARRQQQFLDGDINALSCSTTFELGVDVGDVQTVLLRNVPPTPANYVQRAGRAGRRSGATALAVTFAQQRSHDRHYFQRPEAMIDGDVAAPVIAEANTAIIRRHVHATAFAAFQRLVGRSYKTVEEFFVSEDGVAPVDRFVEWLRSCPADLGETVRRIVPEAAANELGITSWDWVARLVEPDDEGGGAWLARAKDEVRDDLSELDLLKKRAAGDNNFRRAEVFQRVRETLAHRRLIDFLAQRTVLPKYGFPVDVVELDVSRSGDAAAARVDLNRDLRLAIAEYAPRARVVADKRLWEPTGLRIPPGRSLPVHCWMECGSCGKFTTRREGIEPSCCEAPIPRQGRSGAFVVPMFGFLGRAADERVGESRPGRAGFAVSYFDDYAHDVVPTFTLARLGELEVEWYFSRRGRITVINSGMGAGGYSVCMSCGYAGKPDTPKKRTGVRSRGHPRPRNPSSVCDGTLKRLGYGHQYFTDVIEIRPDISSDKPGWVSTLYALLAALPVLGIARQDVDGHLVSGGRQGGKSFVLFDAVPGGAGYARSLTDRLPELFRAAYDIVDSCECGEESSCYSCLRTYSNQPFHDKLSRSEARAMLAPARGTP